jgi:hypothetical protein
MPLYTRDYVVVTPGSGPFRPFGRRDCAASAYLLIQLIGKRKVDVHHSRTKSGKDLPANLDFGIVAFAESKQFTRGEVLLGTANLCQTASCCLFPKILDHQYMQLILPIEPHLGKQF